MEEKTKIIIFVVAFAILGFILQTAIKGKLGIPPIVGAAIGGAVGYLVATRGFRTAL